MIYLRCNTCHLNLVGPSSRTCTLCLPKVSKEVDTRDLSRAILALFR